MCDQATNNVKALHILGAPLGPDGGEESHCFTVGSERVAVIFDVPHLIKSIRNNLFKHGLKVSAAIPRGETVWVWQRGAEAGMASERT